MLEFFLGLFTSTRRHFFFLQLEIVPVQSCPLNQIV